MRLCATVTLFFPVSTWANDAKRGCMSATLKKFARYKVDKNTSEKKTQIEQWNMLNLIARACTQRVHARANVYKKNYNLPSKVSPVGEEFHHNWKFVNWFLFHCFFFLSSSLVSLFSCMFCWLKYCNIYTYICIDSMYARARAQHIIVSLVCLLLFVSVACPPSWLYFSLRKWLQPNNIKCTIIICNDSFFSHCKCGTQTNDRRLSVCYLNNVKRVKIQEMFFLIFFLSSFYVIERWMMIFVHIQRNVCLIIGFSPYIYTYIYIYICMKIQKKPGVEIKERAHIFTTLATDI